MRETASLGRQEVVLKGEGEEEEERLLDHCMSSQSSQDMYLDCLTHCKIISISS